MKHGIDAILQREQALYLETLLPQSDELLAEMEHYAREQGHPIADPEVAQLMRLLIRIRRPRHVVEVGTNIGYSVVALGRECEPETLFETIELDRAILAKARAFVERASLKCQVRFHEGAALDVLPTLQTGIDFAFIDCVKTEYPDYLDALLPKMRHGALIVADNVLWGGQVAAGVEDASTSRIREFNRTIMTHPHLLSTVLPLGDGVSISFVMT